ncbi:MAG: hypothetical protein E7158_00275 [Firmicutes bacterium]|nr:hypothetical protein [Bacillota bacterium]
MKNKILCILIILIILISVPIIIYKYNINKENKDKILFLGDSITERYDLKKYFPNHNIINSGIGGNLTTDILNDLDNRVYTYKPDKIFLLIGTNDIIYSNLSDIDIANNIELIVTSIKKELPKTKIYVESIYPVNYKKNNKVYNNALLTKDNNKRIKKINKLIQKMCNENKCTYIGMYDTLEIFSDTLFNYYTTDGLHINRIGYRIITFKLSKYINE